MAELSLVVKVTFVLVVALLAAQLASRASAAVRALLLTCAFGLLLALPVVSAALPARRIEVPAKYSAPFAPAPAVVTAVTSSGTLPVTGAAAPASPARFSMPPLPVAVRLVWGAGAVGFVAPLLVGLLRLRRLRAHGRPWAHAALPSSIEVILHDEVHVPMTFGALRPVIALPIDAPQWPEADLRRVLRHELEHVRRRDWAVHITARAICAAYWFHPLVWSAWRRLCLESERACDDAVLREENGADYAAQLVSLARRITKHDALPLLSIAGRSHLSARVGAMLTSNVTRGPAGTAAAVSLVTLAVMVGLGIGPLQAVTSIQRAQARASGPAFESMSIRPGASSERCCLVSYPADGHMSATNVDLVDLIVSAYGVYRWQVEGAPKWAGGDTLFAPSTGTNRFDVQATAPRSASPDDRRLMLRTMLANRFQLTVHRDTRSQKVYELVAEPGGHTLQPPGEGPYVAQDDIWLRVDPANLMATLQVERLTMAELTRNLGGILQTRVVDRTGITGTYRVTVRWDANPNRPDVLQPSSGPPRDPKRPTIFEAFPAQLGLRFRETTGAVDYLVVDKAERPTTDKAR